MSWTWVNLTKQKILINMILETSATSELVEKWVTDYGSNNVLKLISVQSSQSKCSFLLILINHVLHLESGNNCCILFSLKTDAAGFSAVLSGWNSSLLHDSSKRYKCLTGYSIFSFTHSLALCTSPYLPLSSHLIVLWGQFQFVTMTWWWPHL